MKLMTWNIQWGRGADGRVDLDRIAAHARRFADADVLCLQEVSSGYPDLPGCDGGNQFEALAARFAGYQAVHGVATDVAGQAGERRLFGNMILSRYPVLRAGRHLLPWPAEPGVQSMQRVAVEATLDSPLGPLRVTTTHLEYYSVAQRLEQIRRLRELHRDAVAHARSATANAQADAPFMGPSRGAAAILTGDFNFTPDSAEFRLLTAPADDGIAQYADAWTIAHPGQPHAPTLGVYDKVQWPGPPFTCDFIFVSEDLAARVEDVQVDAGTDASDHQPMLLVLA
ncbi:endonuclease [Herbaspirillum sp. HC18]|nr:endonuclease [Herbaspirillum sp. HC18]